MTVDMAGLDRLARMHAESELREPRGWPLIAILRWADANQARPRDALNAFGAAAARELARRETAAREAGVLVEGRWPLAFDVAMREYER